MKKIFLSAFFPVAFCLNAQVDLVSDLKLCLPFSGSATDVSGQGNHGVINNATLTADRFNIPNSAYLFGPSGSYIDVGNLSKYSAGNELTISMWAKSKTTTSNCLFEIVNDTPHDRCVGCAQYLSGASTMMIFDWGSIYSANGRHTKAGIPKDTSNWHHYVFTLSQSNNKKQMYLDGMLKVDTIYGQTCFNKSKPLYIGALADSTGGTLTWNGKIDEVCIYNRRLNQNEVTALYNGMGVCFSTGYEELKVLAKSMFYPCISYTGEFHFQGDLTRITELMVVTLDGRILGKFNGAEMQLAGKLNLESLVDGVYLVKYTNGQKNIVQKLVISR